LCKNKRLGGVIIKHKIFLTVLSVLLIVMLIAPVACVGKKTTTPASTDTQLRPDVTALQTKVASLIDTVSNLDTPPNYEPDIDALEQQVADLEASNSDFEDRIAELEAGSPETNGDSGDVDLVTIWKLDVFLDVPLPSLVEIYSIKSYPTRIEEEDTYRLTVTFQNSNINNDGTPEDEGLVSFTGVSMTVIFVPRTKDTVIDAGNTFVDSMNVPYLWWDSTYTPKPVNNISTDCRRIEFYCEPFDFTIPGKVGDSPGTQVFSIDFDLCYAK